jgi:hypothetical protein
VRLVHGIEKTVILREKAVIKKTTEPVAPVLNVLKPPVETISSRHHRLSIDSQKLDDRDITDKLPYMLLATTKVPRMQSQICSPGRFYYANMYFTFTQVKSSAAYLQILDLKI